MKIFFGNTYVSEIFKEFPNLPGNTIFIRSSLEEAPGQPSLETNEVYLASVIRGSPSLINLKTGRQLTSNKLEVPYYYHLCIPEFIIERVKHSTRPYIAGETYMDTDNSLQFCYSDAFQIQSFVDLRTSLNRYSTSSNQLVEKIKINLTRLEVIRAVSHAL